MQPSAPVPPPPGEHGRRGTSRRLLVPVLAACALAVGVPVLWVTGGFAETPQQPAVRAGQPVDLGLFTVTVRDARIGLDDSGIGSTRERFVIVRLHVVNKGKESVGLGIGGLSQGLAARTRKGQWIRPDDVDGVAGGAKTDMVQPGLPVEASAKWKAGPADAPRQFTIGLRKWTYDHGFTDTTYAWRVDLQDDALAGRLTLPVAALTPAPATPSPRVSAPTRPRRTLKPTGRATRPPTRRPTRRATPRATPHTLPVPGSPG
ncbi:hypothetical protein [Actinomadura fibrosa]|uniref:DUF4352 domain-containing protein n=1 Tax=Actinomadura fibrosa TaxID=111802 RepID=A0ABW2XZ92_9ACTN|nr:hypothetical protein [Actinomadura fibrosa]